MFFDNLYKICKQKNTTPNGVAKIVGISSGSVTSWKKGVVPKSDTLQKIAEYLEVSTDYLLGNENKNAPASEDTEARELYRLFKALPEAQQKAIELLLKQKLDK